MKSCEQCGDGSKEVGEHVVAKHMSEVGGVACPVGGEQCADRQKSIADMICHLRNKHNVKNLKNVGSVFDGTIAAYKDALRVICTLNDE